MLAKGTNGKCLPSHSITQEAVRNPYVESVLAQASRERPAFHRPAHATYLVFLPKLAALVSSKWPSEMLERLLQGTERDKLHLS